MTNRLLLTTAIAVAASVASISSYADFNNADYSTFNDFGGNFIETPTEYLQNHPLIVPAASSIFAPTGFGADFGTTSLTALGVNAWPGGNQVDGAAAVGLGLGNGDRYVGLSVTGVVDSLGYRQNLGKNGDMGVKLFRWLTPTTSIAAGVNNLKGWGQLSGYSKTYYGAITQQFSLFNINDYAAPFSISAGAGTGSFVSPLEFNSVKSDSTTRPFAALSFSPIPLLNVIADYTAYVWSAGISGMPIGSFPLILTAYTTNLGGPGKIAGPATYGGMATIAYNFAQ